MHLLSLAICVIRHPFDTYRALQASRDKFRYYPALILLVIIIVARIISMYVTHYPFAGTSREDINMVMEALRFIIPVFTWAFSLFAVTSILDGETNIGEAITSTVYSLVPYAILSIPIALFSSIISLTDSVIYITLIRAVVVWCGFLFFLSVKVMNNYTVKKTILVVFLTLFGMALIWSIALIIFALASQFVLFLTGVYKEARYAIFGY